MSCNKRIEPTFGYDVVGVYSNNLRFFQNFLFTTSPVIKLERYRNENNELIIRKSTSLAVMNWLSGLFIQVYIQQMPVCNHNGWTYETNNQSWLCTVLYTALWEDMCYRTQCDFVYLFHIFTVSHISLFIYYCQALFRSNTSVSCCWMSLPTIFCRNTILIISTSFSLNASLVKFHFPTLCTFCRIASHKFKTDHFNFYNIFLIVFQSFPFISSKFL